jgi:hypothetical protein
VNKSEAQARADRIRAFRAELAHLEGGGVATLTSEQRSAIERHHQQALADLQGRFDVDTTETLKQMSWGMRLASLVGAMALAASVVLFFFQIWGDLTTWQQVAVLALSPLAALAAVEAAARRERTLYVAAILGLIAFACFVLNLQMFGMIFNITPTPNAFLVWSAFGAILAYAYGIRILLVAGILSFMGWLSATVGTWSGCYWLYFWERPENFILSGAILFAVGVSGDLRRPLRIDRRPDFEGIYRVFGLLAIFLPVLVLSNGGEASYLQMNGDAIEILYQLAGFLLSGLAIWIGIRCGWSGVTNTGATFLVLFLYTKFFDWWWDWMPKWIFFLILGAVALGLLLIMKRFRARARLVPA